jgi:hypothetical protein
LGDVVVSKPTGNFGGVVQYNAGKTGVLNRPPQILLAAISQLESTNMIKKNHWISDILKKNPDVMSKFFRPLEQD